MPGSRFSIDAHSRCTCAAVIPSSRLPVLTKQTVAPLIGLVPLGTRGSCHQSGAHRSLTHCSMVGRYPDATMARWLGVNSFFGGVGSGVICSEHSGGHPKNPLRAFRLPLFAFRCGTMRQTGGI